ncbi:MAG: alpha/beta hydrolase [SAR202 cluster bacterium]|nr:alpha/beta hydrolase [SAR202 cluster bacterium]
MVEKSRISYSPAQQFPVKVQDVEYLKHGNTGWLARIYQPQGHGPFPILLDVHGGAWNRGDRTNDTVMNQALAASGVVVAALDYRLAPQHPYPAQVADVNYATRWFKVHAREFNADPSTLGGLGASSGGHTVMLSAMRPHDPRYASVPLPEARNVDASLRYLVCCWPVLDPYARYLYAKKAGHDRLAASGEAYFKDAAAMQEGNPQLILERREKVGLPPTLIIQGTNDDNVPMSIPTNFVREYRANGGQVDIEIFPGMVHGFANTPGAESDRAIALIKGFIAKQLTRAAVLV